MRNYLTFGGIDTRNYGIYISGNMRHNIPQRPYEVVQIAGRMGDLIVGGNMLANEEIVYPAFCAPVNGLYGNYATYEEAISAFRNDLLSVNGYATLTDTYDAAHYRKAVFIGPVEVETSPELKEGSFDLVFNAKPQRYLSNGGTATAVAAGGSVTVDCTKKRSAPVITVTGTGSFSIVGGDGTWLGKATITENDTVIIVDAERMECYDENGNSKNLNVQLLNYEFPMINKPFGAMNTSAVVSATGCSLSVVFNWYEL